MSQAADMLGLAFSTFKTYAKKYNLYSPNQGGKGLDKSKKKLNDVFNGRVHLVTHQLRSRLIKEGFKEYKCEECGITEWNGKKINIVLDLDPRTDGRTWWLNIPHDERGGLQAIRDELGLGRPYFGMHMSIGYARPGIMEEHSKYLHECIKNGFIQYQFFIPEINSYEAIHKITLNFSD